MRRKIRRGRLRQRVSRGGQWREASVGQAATLVRLLRPLCNAPVEMDTAVPRALLEKFPLMVAALLPLTTRRQHEPPLLHYRHRHRSCRYRAAHPRNGRPLLCRRRSRVRHEHLPSAPPHGILAIPLAHLCPHHHPIPLAAAAAVTPYAAALVPSPHSARRFRL